MKNNQLVQPTISLPSPFKVNGADLTMTVYIRKNGHLLAKTDLNYNENGINYLIRNRDDFARTRVPRRKIVNL